MRWNTIIFIVILFFSLSFCHAQDKKYDFSSALDVNTEGWNKVLCMKNGNTLLFHIEPAKRIEVTVFDATHKQVASQKEPYKILDVFMVTTAVFKGLYEINGDAVMFLDQAINGRHCLIMLRYNTHEGKLIEERLVGESKSKNRQIKYYVMKNREDDNYQVLFCMDKRHPKESDIFMVYFNKNHESVKEVQLDLERAKYDYLEVIGAEAQPNGVLITLGLDKALIYSRATDLSHQQFAMADHDSALRQGGSVYEHYVAYYYLPKDSTGIRRGMIDVTQAIFPHYALYTYNKFAEAINLLVYSYKPVYYQFGYNERIAIASRDVFLKIDEHDLNTTAKVLSKSAANELLFITDSAKLFEGMPVKLFTNEHGVSTLFSQSYMRYGIPETNVRYAYEDYIGNMRVAQYDDTGKEMWSAELPLAQYYVSNQKYLDEKEFSKRWQEEMIFGDLPAQVYNRQFLSFNTFCHDKDFYIIYNDYSKNAEKSMIKRRDTVYDFGSTNAYCYKVNRKREVTKFRLYGQQPVNEHISSFIAGADFDEQRGIYASLVQINKGKNKTILKMAWQKID